MCQRVRSRTTPAGEELTGRSTSIAQPSISQPSIAQPSIAPPAGSGRQSPSAPLSRIRCSRLRELRSRRPHAAAGSGDTTSHCIGKHRCHAMDVETVNNSDTELTQCTMSLSRVTSARGPEAQASLSPSLPEDQPLCNQHMALKQLQRHQQQLPPSTALHLCLKLSLPPSPPLPSPPLQDVLRSSSLLPDTRQRMPILNGCSSVLTPGR